MKLATMNLYQFAEHGLYWYEREDRNTYQSREWKKKQQWVRDQLTEMDADIVGFQEVFSPKVLEELVNSLGYKHFVTVDSPKASAEDSVVLSNPVVALASKFPIKSATTVEKDPTASAALPIEDDFKFSRLPVRATIDAPDIGEVVVYVVHLKSKRSVMDNTVTYPEDMPWPERYKDTLLRRARGDALSMIQRGLEATLIYHDAMAQYQHCDKLVVMGDLNDDEFSSPLDIITQRQKAYDIGGIDYDEWPEESKRALHDCRLFDSFSLAPTIRSKARPYTHLHQGNPNVLDHILVSNGLNSRNKNAEAEVCHYEVFNHHIRGDNVDNKLQSDHGLVCIEIIPCAIPEAKKKQPLHAKPKRIWTRQGTPATECERQAFIEMAGGVYQSRQSYRQLKSQDKWQRFWSFFFDTEHGWVKSVYGSIPVDTLVQKKRHTIEHIVPRSFLQEYLIRKRIPRNVRFGAETNPFNWVPADRTLNSRRSSFQFDFEGDKVVRPEHIHLNPDAYASTGTDHDEEWVVPKRSQGDIARAILYMLLVYEIDELYLEHINTLVHWAKADVPSKWEIAYNEWVFENCGIRNPFIDKQTESKQWLNDKDLLSGLLCN
ncbi:endonuclease I [Leucothrix sargassi]|nr:endonuclease I [Leucothrix sargassi]